LSYVRKFPQLFKSVALTAGGDPAQLVSAVYLALVCDGGEWSARLVELMRGGEVAAVYRYYRLIPDR